MSDKLLFINSAITCLATFKVIDCGNYGWEEFVESKPCSDMQQLRNYYYRFGELILQNYILNANDLHEENVIAYDICA